MAPTRDFASKRWCLSGAAPEGYSGLTGQRGQAVMPKLERSASRRQPAVTLETLFGVLLGNDTKKPLTVELI